MGNKSARELVLFRLIYMRIGVFPLVLLPYTREMGDSTELESFSPFFMADSVPRSRFEWEGRGWSLPHSTAVDAPNTRSPGSSFPPGNRPSLGSLTCLSASIRSVVRPCWSVNDASRFWLGLEAICLIVSGERRFCGYDYIRGHVTAIDVVTPFTLMKMGLLPLKARQLIIRWGIGAEPRVYRKRENR